MSGDAGQRRQLGQKTDRTDTVEVEIHVAMAVLGEDFRVKVQG